MRKAFSIIIIITILSFCRISAFVELQTTASAQEMSNVDKTFINSCETVSYQDVARNPSQYKGRNIRISGSVIQVMEGWFKTITMRVDEGSNNIWYVTYTREDDNESRILENDYITIYGECDGVETYTTIFGGSVTIPSIKAVSITGNDHSDSGSSTEYSDNVGGNNLLPSATWICQKCGSEASGNFCSNCGNPKVESQDNYDEVYIDTGNIEDIIPKDDTWKITSDQLPETDDFEYEPCSIGNKQGFRISAISIGTYIFDEYLVFDRVLDGKLYLSKIVYLLSDSDKLSNDDLVSYYLAFIEDITSILGKPNSEKSTVTTWKKEKYTIEVGKGKFKNYTGSEALNTAIVIKYNSAASSASKKKNDKPPKKKADYKLLKDYKWESYSNYYEGLVIKNTSGETKEFDAQVMFYDNKNNLVGVGNYTADVVGNGQKAIIICNNETAFHHIEHTITARNTNYHEVQSFINVQTNIVDRKVIIIAKNKGNVAAEFVEYHCLFINKKGKVVGTGWGYLVDSDSELKPGMTEFREESCYEPFKTVELYFTGRY